MHAAQSQALAQIVRADAFAAGDVDFLHPAVQGGHEQARAHEQRRAQEPEGSLLSVARWLAEETVRDVG